MADQPTPELEHALQRTELGSEACKLDTN